MTASGNSDSDAGIRLQNTGQDPDHEIGPSSGEPAPTVGQAAELAELLALVNDWLATDQQARISLDRFVGRAYTAQNLRTDLYRFILLLGGTFATKSVEDHRPDC